MMGSRGLGWLVFMMLILSNTYAQNHQSHCDLNFGYHFYCDDSTQAEEEAKEEKKEKQTKTNRDYKLELEQTKQELESKKAKAILLLNSLFILIGFLSKNFALFKIVPI